MRTVNDEHDSFVCADSRVAPRGASFIPRLELCAAVEISCAAPEVKKEQTIDIRNTKFYTDSRVVIGYISNELRRFTKSVARRVEFIRSRCSAEYWLYVNTSSNPADIATCPITADKLERSIWLKGPRQLWDNELYNEDDHEFTPVSELPEQEAEFVTLHTYISANKPPLRARDGQNHKT